jgi:polysaccharide export outer membrane protein
VKKEIPNAGLPNMPDLNETLRMHSQRVPGWVLLIVLSAATVFAQEPPVQEPVAVAPQPVAAPVPGTQNSGSYRLGAGDQIMIRASNSPELNEKTFRIDLNGYINAPTIGRIMAAGSTVEALERELLTRMRVFLQEPDVAVSVMEYQSQPVSIFGEVATPGVHQLQGRKTLVELLSMAGGLKVDAGPLVRITRDLQYGRIPLEGAADDPTGKYSIAQLELKPLIAAKTPEKDIAIQPYDIISVPRAELIYIAGDVTKSGPVELTDRTTISVLEALSATGGVTKTADTKKGRILRSVPGSSIRAQVPVNISKIMTGKSNDVQMMAGDILVVPPSSTKKAAQRALEMAIQVGTVVMTSGLATGAL